MGEMRRTYTEELGIDGKIILECFLGKQGVNVWSGLIWLRIGFCGEVF
jgi:hypothetical protein